MRALAIALALTLGACAGTAGPGGAGRGWIGAQVPAPASRDALLRAAADRIWRGDLAAAAVALTALADRERGRTDTALDYWSDLLALLRCEPLSRAPRADDANALHDPWERLRRLVQIERVRLSRAVPRLPGSARLLSRLDDRAGGARTQEVVWPVEREHWSDETPVPALITRCWPVAEASRAGAASDPASAAEVALIAATARALPPNYPAVAPLRLEAGVLELARGEAAPAVAALSALGRGGALAGWERDDAVFGAALAAIADPALPAQTVMARARAAFALDRPAVERRSLALLLAERLDADKRPEDAVAILGAPPHGDDVIGRYIAFHQAMAHARAGRRAELLAEAREALHRHGRADVQADPALAAVMDLALRTLQASPVSPETIEVLESLGPPRERLARAEAFAEMALAAGADSSAMATFAWLYQNDPDTEGRLQHLAHECVAAARAREPAEFARTFRLLAGQDEPPLVRPATGAKGRLTSPGRTAVPARAPGLIASAEAENHHAHQRAERSADWQRALLVVARDALPSLVDNDDQVDLGTLVATLKRHLDDAGRGPVDDELTTLYRAASAHLKTGPRAYAETVGAARRPILLGDILIGRRYEVQPPAIELTSALAEAGPLVFVPRHGTDPSPASLRRWPGGFRVVWTGGGR